MLRNRISSALYATAILYAFPLGLYLDPLFSAGRQNPGASTLLSVSALLSYLSAAALAGLPRKNIKTSGSESAQAMWILKTVFARRSAATPAADDRASDRVAALVTEVRSRAQCF